MTEKPSRTAIVLFNLGGPDCPEAVRPFLFNLFNDPSIIGLPTPLRLPLAHFIARRRAGPAGKIYDLIGGRSPLLENTQAQARALETALESALEPAAGEGGGARAFKTFIAMRYWHPMSGEAALAVKDYDPDRIVLLPLYPQYSTTTTASSVRVWQRAARAAGLDRPTVTVCCYPTEPGFIAAAAALVRRGLEEAGRAESDGAQTGGAGRPRVLFSAHGLPKKIVRAGDPYQVQCERTAAAIVRELGVPDLDWVSCYQSRVGPLEWIGPSTDAEIRRAGADRVPIVVVPIAFVSEHSETLVEIEIEYRHLAETAGVPRFVRVPTVGAEPAFIDGLARLVRQALASGAPLLSETGDRLCPPGCGGCPQAPGGTAGA